MTDPCACLRAKLYRTEMSKHLAAMMVDDTLAAELVGLVRFELAVLPRDLDMQATPAYKADMLTDAYVWAKDRGYSHAAVLKAIGQCVEVVYV